MSQVPMSILMEWVPISLLPHLSKGHQCDSLVYSDGFVKPSNEVLSRAHGV